MEVLMNIFKNINWKIRFSRENILYIAQVALSVFTPVLAYFGITGADFTTWVAVWNFIVDAVANPYVVGLMIVAFFNATTDPTTKGITDSTKALTYTKPN